MIEIDWSPDRKKLREFGFIGLAGFGLMGLLLGWKFGWFESGDWLYPGIFAGLGIFSAALAVIEPYLLKPLYWLLTAISAVIGPIVATLILALLFILVFLPIGLVFKLRGRDELKRNWDKQADSYWLPADLPQDARRYFRQY
ncbi:MAG: SxtJ family membrane protein [Akkermansiaceae bacterium]